MKSVGYLCSYSKNSSKFAEEIDFQKESLLKYAQDNDICIDTFFKEDNFAREDLKPVLLTLINQSFGKFDKIFIYDINVLSSDVDFRDWVKEELQKINVELVSVIEGEEEIEPVDKANLILERIKTVPSLPEVVVKVVQLVQDKNSSAEALSKVISHDLGLTSRVLKLVNSAYYGFEKQISSIQQAVTILGFTTIRGLVLSSCVYKMFKPPKNSQSIFDYKEFWQHSLLCAFGAKILTEKIENSKADDVFSAAILHDFGKLLLAQYDYSNYAKVYATTIGNGDWKKTLELEDEFCEVNHCVVAWIVLNAWNLPDIISEVALYHHEPMKAVNSKMECLIVSVANVLADVVLYKKELNINQFDEEILNSYGITFDMIYSAQDEIIEESEIICDIDEFFKEEGF